MPGGSLPWAGSADPALAGEKRPASLPAFTKTLFFDGQFTEPIAFDRFQIRWIE